MLACALLALAAGAPIVHASGPAAGPIDQPAAEAAMRSALAAIGRTGTRARDTERWRTALIALYGARHFAPLWLDHGTPTRSAAAVIGALQAADAFGLEPSDYEGARLLGRAADLAASPGRPVADAARLDLDVSIAVARFVADLFIGRIDPRAAGHSLDIPHAPLDLPAALGALATADVAAVPGVLRRYEPPFHHYDLLKQSLATYRELAKDASLTVLPAPGRKSVKPGEAYSGAAALARLLGALGDLPGVGPGAHAGEAGRLDAPLSTALKRFQERHGLTTDGALGTGTWRALTTPMSRRVRQIELSLERSRWLPPKLGRPPIIVNIPQFRLFAFNKADDENSMLSMEVIVGKTFPQTHTPIFAADMKYVVFRPYWDVPRSIAQHELLPKLRADPSWAERNGFEIVRGQGDDARPMPASVEVVAALAAGQLRIRQKPGPQNSLGLAKFMLPNRYDVYLHSTPAQSLFARTARAFSHGCVRVEDPVALAEYVLRDDPAWTRERIVAAMGAGQSDPRPMRVELREPIRVFLIYETALAAEDGRTFFFEDIYGHDARLDTLLRAHRPALAARRQPLAGSSSRSSRQAPRGRNGEPEKA